MPALGGTAVGEAFKAPRSMDARPMETREVAEGRGNRRGADRRGCIQAIWLSRSNSRFGVINAFYERRAETRSAPANRDGTVRGYVVWKLRCNSSLSFNSGKQVRLPFSF